MRRAFDLYVLACPRCGGRLRLSAPAERERARFMTVDQRRLRRAVSLKPGTALVDFRSLDA